MGTRLLLHCSTKGEARTIRSAGALWCTGCRARCHSVPQCLSCHLQESGSRAEISGLMLLLFFVVIVQLTTVSCSFCPPQLWYYLQGRSREADYVET
jgi:hypothetical protein